MSNPPKLLHRMADVLRTRHYSDRTREAYVAWARRFILFHGKRHPSSMGADEVNAYLTAHATRDHVSAATQNQALCAILFLYRHVLGDPLPWIRRRHAMADDQNQPKKNIYGEREKDIQNNDPNRNIQGTPADQDIYGQRRNERGEPEKK